MFCHIIPLCLKSHHSKSSREVVLNSAVDVADIYCTVAETDAECNPGTLSVLCSLKVKKCSCSFGPVKILK